MVSPGTHLAKNHESQSRTNESQFKKNKNKNKKTSPKLKMFGPLCNPGADLGGGCRGCARPPEMACGFLIQLVFCQKKNYVVYWC